jgi:predicted nucleic acid-binding Zn ribbon protein
MDTQSSAELDTLRGAIERERERAGQAEKAADLQRKWVDQAEIRVQQALHRAATADTDRRAADARGDAAMVRADTAEINRRATQVRADAAEDRAQRTEDRRAGLRDRLDATQAQLAAAEQTAEHARHQMQDAQAPRERFDRPTTRGRAGAAWRGSGPRGGGSSRNASPDRSRRATATAMSARSRQRFMVSIAVQRVLARTHDRSAIGSLATLKRAYEEELAAHGTEIAAEADRQVKMQQAVLQRVTTDGIRQHRRCEGCGGTIEDAVRSTRWFCSDRCRQRAHRKRQLAAP